MTFILPSFGASAISAVPASGGGGGSAIQNDYSLDFDGTNSWLDIGDISSLTGSQANLSLSYWVNETSSTAHQGHLGSQGSTLGAIIFFSGNWYFYNWKTGSEDLVVSRPTTGVWHSVIVTMNNSYQKVFVDGVLRYYNTASGSTLSTLYNDFNVGKDRNNVYANAKIDEVALYQSTLSDGGVTSTGTTATGDVADIYNSGVPTDLTSYSPIGWWRMGDNDSGTGTTVTDQGSGGNDGTLTNSPTFVQGVPSVPAAYSNTYSLDFDGTDDYVSTELSVAGESELTVSAWVKLDTVSATKGFVAQYNVGGDRAFRLAHFPSLSSMWFEVYGSNSYAGYKDTSITTGTWYHVAGVFSQSSCVCYVNGVASTTTTGLHTSNTGNVATCTDNIDIGRMGNVDYMDGNIDEVGVWTSALSASDITAIYNSGVPTDISSYSPVLYYRMGDNDGGTGTTITDQGSGGNDGTLTNGPTFSTTVPS